MRLCSVKEMCTSDIIGRMERMGIGKDEQDAILKRLIEEGFLNEERYATAFVRDKSRISSWGRVKIRYALRSKGISDEIIDASLEEVTKDEERDRLHRLLTLKAKSMKMEEPRDKRLAKLVRFAIARGFDYDSSVRVAKEIIG